MKIKTSNIKLEKNFQTNYILVLRAVGYICYKIPDIGAGYKHLDMIGYSESGEHFSIEFKIVPGYTFSFAKFEDSQILLLNTLSTRPKANVFVAIYSKKTQTFCLTTFKYLYENKNDLGGVKIFSKGTEDLGGELSGLGEGFTLGLGDSQARLVLPTR